jgi:hypothetical protein
MTDDRLDDMAMIRPKHLALTANVSDDPEANTGLSTRNEPRTVISASAVVRSTVLQHFGPSMTCRVEKPKI